jgi:nucleotide-binding universal stress UspA family protein
MDFSERCLAAAPFVEAFAKRYGAKVTLFSAVQPLSYPGLEDAGAATYYEPDVMRESLQKRLAGTLAGDLQGVSVTRIADLGEPAQCITKFADENRVDLIMMPTHGRGVFRRLLLGSVTAKVLHDAHCPVWTSAHAEDLAQRGHPNPRKILCAVDLSAASAGLIRWAAQLVGDTGASLRLVHAVPGGAAWPERQFSAELELALKEKARKEITALLDSTGLDFPACIDAGDVAPVVAEEAQGHGADLIVIGRGVIHEKLGRLRTHAHAIIRQAPCPVISV